MGWRYRKSVNVGPLRINMSKKGIGWSVGGPMGRTTFTADGKVRTTRTIKGTGISYVEEYGGNQASAGNVGARYPKYSRGSYVAARILSLIAAWLIVAVAVLGVIGGSAIVAVAFVPFAALFFLFAAASRKNIALIDAGPQKSGPEVEAAAIPDRMYLVCLDTCTVHRPDCAAAQRIAPDKRMTITTNLQKLRASGYKPCKRCNPQ